MEVFVGVVDSGNFTLAASRLGITSVMVGKQIRQLETLYGASLLKRNTRQQGLTDAGALLYRRAKVILAQVAQAQEALHEMAAAPRGTLRVSAPVSMGGCLIAPLVAGYLARFPDMQIELVLGNAKVDLIEDGYDLAIRVGALPDSGLVARGLRPYRTVICAAPAYLARAGTPRCWADLAAHRCLAHQSWHATWVGGDGAELAWPRQGVLSCNDGYALRAAAIAGAGLILQPEALLDEAIRAGLLVPVLADFLPPPLPAHLIYLQDAHPRRKLASLVDYLLAELGTDVVDLCTFR